MKTLVIGMGEVGKAHYELLKDSYNSDVYCRDIDNIPLPDVFDLLIICIQYNDHFENIAKQYALKYKPKLINICTTVPVGTCAKLGEEYHHSTTRGLHPNLKDGLLNITKHIGGAYSDKLARYFRGAGITCVAHRQARTTELAHILNNTAYGVSLVLADEMQRICRHYGVDYYQAVMQYTDTNNAGFISLGNDTKVRMILTPPNGNIGGHCINMSAGLLPKEIRTPLIDIVAKYGKGE